MKRSSLFSVLAGAALLVAAAAPAGAYVKSTWFNGANAAHKVVTGDATTFKAVCDDPAATTIEVTLSGAPIASGSGTNSFALETDPVVLGAGGTYTVTVKDALGVTIGTDTYAVTLVSGTNATDLKEIAIENGLWYLHKTMSRYATIPNGAPGGFLDYNGDPNWYPRANPGTVMAGQAFFDAGHTLAVNGDDPYVEDLQRIINWTTEHLGIISLGANEARSSTTFAPKDGRGVFFSIPEGSPEIEYGFGPALKLIASCYSRTSTATPQAWNDALNCGTGGSIRTFAFPRIMQEMVDFLAWAQLTTVGNDYHTGDTFCPTKSTAAVAPGSKGGWPYWNEGWRVDPEDEYSALTGGDGTYGDVAVAYWTVQGLSTALATLANNTGIFPAALRTNLLTFITDHINPLTGEVLYGPAHNIHLVERAGQGLAVLRFAGVTSTSDARVLKLIAYIKRNWSKHTYHHEQGHPDQNYICHDEFGAEKQCYQHFLVDANPAGFWICDRNQDPCSFEIVQTLDDLNIFAFKAISEGLSAYYPTANPNVPAAAPGDHKTVYRGLLIDNQLDNGCWDDHGWVQGYQPMGAAWAISLLAKNL